MREEMVKNSKRQISLMAAVVVAAILLMTTVGVAMTGTSLASDSEPASGSVDKEFTIWARQFDFIPAVITVQQGDYVRLNLKNADVAHGLYIDGYDINIKANGGETKSVEFVADKAGTFKIRCSVTCGPFHPFVAGKFVVQQSPNIIPWLIIAGVVAVVAVSLGILASQLWWRNRRDKSK
jgi:cytochrome c oxidase subunit 2